MVSFTCDVCQDVVRKNAVEKHCARYACKDAWYFTCIDCNKIFEGYDYQEHSNCITEEQKYYGKLAKGKKSPSNLIDTAFAQKAHSKSNQSKKPSFSDDKSPTNLAEGKNNAAAELLAGVRISSDYTSSKGKEILSEIKTTAPCFENGDKIVNMKKNREGSQKTDTVKPCLLNISSNGGCRWIGNWQSTLHAVLSSKKSKKMKWRALCKKVMKLYFEAHPDCNEDKDTIKNMCLMQIPEEFLNDTDPFVRLKE